MHALSACRAVAAPRPCSPRMIIVTRASSASSAKPTAVVVGGRSTARRAQRRRLERRRARLAAQQQQQLEMPLAGGGALWLLDRDLPDPLYGEGFVLRRAADEWCWVDKRQQPRQPQQHKTAAPLAALPPPPLLLPYQQRECLALVSVPVGDDEAAQMGIVPYGQDPQSSSPQADDAAMHAFLFGGGDGAAAGAADGPPSSPSPRRTSRVRFTCRRCGQTTQRAVNPHAWRRGTVFAKCGGCGVTHKLIDNLKLCDDYDLRAGTGPAFFGGGGAPDGDRDAPPMISTDFRAGNWTGAGELGLPLGLRWLIEEDEDGGKGPGDAAQA